jgi:hypothetical protein
MGFINDVTRLKNEN